MTSKRSHSDICDAAALARDEETVSSFLELLSGVEPTGFLVLETNMCC